MGTGRGKKEARYHQGFDVSASRYEVGGHALVPTAHAWWSCSRYYLLLIVLLLLLSYYYYYHCYCCMAIISRHNATMRSLHLHATPDHQLIIQRHAAALCHQLSCSCPEPLQPKRLPSDRAWVREAARGEKRLRETGKRKGHTGHVQGLRSTCRDLVDQGRVAVQELLYCLFSLAHGTRQGAYPAAPTTKPKNVAAQRGLLQGRGQWGVGF